MNQLVMAYLGDAVYELYIRNYLIQNDLGKVKELKEKSLNYVSAVSQRRVLDELVSNSFLTNEELDIIKEGRNTKGGKSKSTDIVTYRIATGLECLFGYLYLHNNIKRIEEIVKEIMK